MKIWQLMGGAFVALSVQGHLAHAKVELHVSTHGTHSGTGTATDPLASLQGARDRIRELRRDEQWQPQPIVVLIHAGTYQLSETFVLQAEDSGDADAPITYSAAPNEKVILSGAASLLRLGSLKDLNAYPQFPAEIRSQLIVFELDGPKEQFQISRRHHNHAMAVAPSELYDARGRLPRAGWPNTDWARVEDLSSTENAWKLPLPVSKTSLASAWTHGFWEHDYQDTYEAVVLNDQGQIQIEANDIRVRSGARYRVENVLECLDSPGEWFVDAENQRLIVWPKESHDSQPLFLSQLETIVSFYDVEHVAFVGLDIQAATVTGVEIAGGANCLIDQCRVGCIGNVGINVYHGFEHVVSNCEVYATASSGIRIEGGNRETLEPADHVCKNNSIHDCGYSYLARRAGVEVHGVGIVIEKNEIAALPDWAVHLNGNDHLVHLNHIHHVCRETSDTGAIYLAHDPTFRGNVIRHNHIEAIGGFDKRDVIGIYLDDFASGATIEGNLIENAPRGIAIGGGRDNTVRNNVIRDCLAAIQIDCRGASWANHHVSESEHSMEVCLASVRHDQSPYLERYPQLANLLDDDPEHAKGNVIESNVMSCPIAIDLQGIAREFVTIRNNTKRIEDVFQSLALDDFRVRESEIARRLNIASIPIENMGLQRINPQYLTWKLP